MSDNAEQNTVAATENENDAEVETGQEAENENEAEEVKDETPDDENAGDSEDSGKPQVAAGTKTATEESVIRTQRRHFPGKTDSSIFG
ncbi:hypothetical protein TNIN_435871 [Trichonephila inaurata madagascariensis]|uniref:Uncharacterized protein n=1 Tax=Trichonephila inaurata madagascariensis TaxID=2747483 RepID=A0A8X7BTR6_9ARAC|nr:hypothetical protein TNIN_435871 [Trichonephila inaurata madagascariensis]